MGKSKNGFCSQSYLVNLSDEVLTEGDEILTEENRLNIDNSTFKQDPDSLFISSPHKTFEFCHMTLSTQLFPTLYFSLHA